MKLSGKTEVLLRFAQAILEPSVGFGNVKITRRFASLEFAARSSWYLRRVWYGNSGRRSLFAVVLDFRVLSSRFGILGASKVLVFAEEWNWSKFEDILDIKGIKIPSPDFRRKSNFGQRFWSFVWNSRRPIDVCIVLLGCFDKIKVLKVWMLSWFSYECPVENLASDFDHCKEINVCQLTCASRKSQLKIFDQRFWSICWKSTSANWRKLGIVI